MTAPVRIGLVGFGKIARDQHLPAIAANPPLELVAVASRNASLEGVANYPDLSALLAGEPALDAVILCQPPAVRFVAAREALLAGKHVFLEKPPGLTVGEVEILVDIARRQGVALFASWHSRYGSAVEAARAWIAARAIDRIEIAWKEDVRRWHPGQAWIWEPGGFGVFDPGINALSILTALLPGRIRVVEAALEVPGNRQTPIAAVLALESADGVPVSAEFDWRQTGPQTWDIAVHAGADQLLLRDGGNSLGINGEPVPTPPEAEYSLMYARFRQLVTERAIDVDSAPLQLVADAMLCGAVRTVEDFGE